MSKIYDEARAAALELIEVAELKGGELVVVGCSTSEVIGEKIGTSGSLKTAEEIYKGLMSAFDPMNIQLAAQCCEHLNRALVVEKETADKYGYEQVCVVPQIHAGGSFGTTVYKNFSNPVMVEEIKADAGIDIGNTLIGMHLKRVAVPVRLKANVIGSAHLNAARTRPKFIGGIRARYE